MEWILDFWRDPETMADVGGIVDRDEQWGRDWYRRMVDPGDGTNCFFLLCLRDGPPIGEVSFHRWQPIRRTADLNIKIRANERGRGYGAEALGLFLQHYFQTIKAARLEDPILPGNAGARALLEKAGFRCVEETDEHHLMVLTRKAWLERRNEKALQRITGEAQSPPAMDTSNGEIAAVGWSMRNPNQATTPSREEAFAGVDIRDILQDNLSRQLKHEKPLGAETRRFGRRRRRDYIALMIGGNALLLLVLILVPDLLVRVGAGAGMVLYSIGITWILYGVMSDY